MSHIFSKLISQKTNLPEKKVAATIVLLDEGATIPFISRYRKEATGSLDEVEIADIQKELNRLKEIAKRKETILKTIGEQGKLTDHLRQRIERCWDATELEDIYLPYKPKRKTRASAAREKGLEPLADFIFEQRNQRIDGMVGKFLNDQVETEEDALKGARDIIAEWIAEDAEIRNSVRFSFEKGAQIAAKVVKSKKEVELELLLTKNERFHF